MRSPALTGAIGMMRPPPCAAITSTTVAAVTGNANAAKPGAADGVSGRRAS